MKGNKSVNKTSVNSDKWYQKRQQCNATGCCCCSVVSHVWLFATRWTAAHQTSVSSNVVGVGINLLGYSSLMHDICDSPWISRVCLTGIWRRAMPSGENSKLKRPWNGTEFGVSERRPRWLECAKDLESDTDEVEEMTGTNSSVAL